MGPLLSWWREALGPRSWWMNGLMLICAYLAILYVPWDFLAKPVADDEEVWLGIVLRGWHAKATEPLHAAIYAAGAYGFWRMRPWMWPWAAVYSANITVSMLVWNIAYVGGLRGWLLGPIYAGAFAALTSVLWRAREDFHRPRPSLRERYGEWALITGASSGIGVEFARALAREGMSCVLTARREDRLQSLAKELGQTHKVATRVVAADLADPQGVDRLVDAVADLDISALVNNAGFGYVGRFDKQDTERLRALVQVNCLAPVVLTSRLLPGMRKRGRGAVVITGSVAGNQPMPRAATYSASKGFARLFGESLWGELRGTGVDVVVLEPGRTETEFHAVAGEIPHPGESPAKVVQVALEALGRQPSVVSGWFNWIRAQATRILPRSTVVLVADGVTAKITPTDMR